MELNSSVEIKPYECNICKKSFSAPTTFKVLKRMHTWEKPYSCKICGKKFSQNSHFHTHMRAVHDAQEPIKCLSCEICIKTKCLLKVHPTTHTPKLPCLAVYVTKYITRGEHCFGIWEMIMEKEPGNRILVKCVIQIFNLSKASDTPQRGSSKNLEFSLPYLWKTVCKGLWLDYTQEKCSWGPENILMWG